MGVLVSSLTDPGKKLPENDATVTCEKDDVTVEFLRWLEYGIIDIAYIGKAA